MYLSSLRNNLCLSPTLALAKTSKSARLLIFCLSCIHLRTRNSAPATMFSIRQPRRPRSFRIHLRISVKDTPLYQDVGTQTDPEPDSSHYYFLKNSLIRNPIWWVDGEGRVWSCRTRSAFSSLEGFWERVLARNLFNNTMSFLVDTSSVWMAGLDEGLKREGSVNRPWG